MSIQKGKTGSSAKRRPDLDTVFTINDDGSRNFIHPADVKGRWQRRKEIAWTFLIAIYLTLPWIQIGGHPALHLDLPGRRAYLLGSTFTNQDFYLVFFLISGMGFMLFMVTALWGRIWCGYACPQTVFLEGVYRRIERLVEGPRASRMRRNAGPMSMDKAWRKTVKHGLFLAFSAVIAHAFLAYFLPARELLQVIRSNPADHWVAFLWTMAWTAGLYFNYTWFREQLCVVICPYGRLQSTLIDRDTVVIGYDKTRGEPRSPKAKDGGDCIDCFRCVSVCPTGIDIRNGLQLECVGCANCIDACDEIMTKLDRPTGLVRYDSERRLSGGERRGYLRGRVLIYAALFIVGLTVFLFSASGRTPFDAKVLRQKGLPFILEEEKIRNLYNIHVQNKTDTPRVYFVSARLAGGSDAPATEFVTPVERLPLEPFADRTVPIFALVDRKAWSREFSVIVSISDSVENELREIDVRFRGP